MRNEEVEKAINITQQLKQFIKERGKDFYFCDNENSVIAYENLGTLLSYISELEKGIERLKKKNKELSNEIIDVKVDKVTKNFIHKNVIRDKIKEIEEIPDQMVKEYGIPEESKNIFLNEKGIQVLKELLGEEYDN